MRTGRRRMRPVLARLLKHRVSGARTAVGPQRRTALVAVLRAVEIFCFAPVAGNHLNPKKQDILSRKPLHTPSDRIRVVPYFGNLLCVSLRASATLRLMLLTPYLPLPTQLIEHYQDPAHRWQLRFNDVHLLRKRPAKTSYKVRTFLQELVSNAVASVCSKMKQFDNFSRRSYRFGTSGSD